MLINDFYANREILITGGSGYMGKSLVEKLLRDSTKIKVIYLLMRGKKSLSPNERLEQYKKDKVFDQIHERCPEVFNKLQTIEGDCSELGLGIQPSDLKLLQNVSIIFHMAANVRFDNPLRSSILLNTRGTHELIKIAETLKNLVVFLHCSTAYCNPFEETIEEKVYQMAVNWRQAIKIAESCDESILNILWHKYTGFYPNTYTFTKNLSEQLIKEYSTKLPISLFRPSIVISSWREPACGWLDNLNGPIAGMIALSVGILPVVYSRGHMKLDSIPVDLSIKQTIVAAYKRGMQFLRKETISDGLEVINCAAGELSNLDMNLATSLVDNAARVNPMENKIWDYDLPHITSCYYNFVFQIFVYAIPQAIVIDLMLRVMGRKPMVLQMVRRAVFATDTITFFITRKYRIINKNMINLETSIPASDIPIYGVHQDFDLNVTQYFNNIYRGVKHYLLDQPKEATAEAQKRAKILYFVSRSLRVILISLLVLNMWSMVQRFF